MKTAIKTFIKTARAEKRTADIAWGTGALDALNGKEAAGERFGANHGAYLAGWCKVHGI